MTEINANIFSTKSIERAISKLEACGKEFQQKQDILLRRLAELGANTANNHYSSGGIDDNDSVTVTITPIDNGYVISAEGKDVYFLEFGTGLAAGNGYDTSVISPPVDISSGSWSRTKGTGEFERYGSWHHDGRRYTMTVPRMGMYFAVKEIQAQLPSIAKEVFND